jgi:hypothetical protein
VKILLCTTIAFVFTTLTQAAIPADYAGTPYSGDTIKGKPQQIPGIIKGVFFDEGGENVAYHDNTPGKQDGGSNRKNAGGQTILADESVEMQAFQDGFYADYNFNTGSKEVELKDVVGSWHLGWIDPGEWVKFTVHVNTAGIYYISLKQATDVSLNLATILFNDGGPDSIKNLKACRPLPPGCQETYHAWNVYNNVDSMALDTGLFVLKYEFVKGGLNFDWIKFTLKSGTSSTNRPSLKTNRAMKLAAAITNSTLNVSYSLAYKGMARLSVSDCAGRIVFSTQLRNAGVEGIQNSCIKLPLLSKGLYIVRIDQAGEAATSIAPVLK